MGIKCDKGTVLSKNQQMTEVDHKWDIKVLSFVTNGDTMGNRDQCYGKWNSTIQQMNEVHLFVTHASMLNTSTSIVSSLLVVTNFFVKISILF